MRRQNMKRYLYFTWMLLLLPMRGAETANWLLGRWEAKTAEIEATAEFTAAGTFSQTAATREAKESHSGRYEQSGQFLQLLPEGAPGAIVFGLRFLDRDTLVLTDGAGQAVTMKRRPISPNRSSASITSDGLASGGASSPSGNPPGSALAPSPPAGRTNLATAASPGSLTKKLTSLVLEKTWEPNERAFWFLKPKGWLMTGGVFNVDPLQVNGPGNTLSPKNDLSVKKDEAGTVMFRWAPVWFYADLSMAGVGASAFPVGSYYRGMMVKPKPTPKSHLLELLSTTRPGISDCQVIAEDRMPEVLEAYEKTNQQLNQGMVQMGLRPNAYDALALLVEYAEHGQRFREAMITVLVDARASAFSWSNERTIMMRAPVAEYDLWKPVLDVIRASDHMNPAWVAAVNRQVAVRTKMVQDTDRYINRVANEIVENRRKTHAESRHEQWLFISGREEYKNPFTGEIERDSSSFRHRWVNNQGDVILTDHNDFDPNQTEEYKTREWKPSAVWDRNR